MDIYYVFQIIGDALYLFFPAYVANAIPVILGRGKPIDFGKNFIDGKPLFGSHKTIIGFLSGIIMGTVVGALLFSVVTTGTTVEPRSPVLIGFMLSLGAMIGDLCGSFIKRRLNREPGASLFPLDQIAFVIGAIIFLEMVFAPRLIILGTILVITPPIHVVTNVIGKKLGF